MPHLCPPADTRVGSTIPLHTHSSLAACLGTTCPQTFSCPHSQTHAPVPARRDACRVDNAPSHTLVDCCLGAVHELRQEGVVRLLLALRNDRKCGAVQHRVAARHPKCGRHRADGRKLVRAARVLACCAKEGREMCGAQLGARSQVREALFEHCITREPGLASWPLQTAMLSSWMQSQRTLHTFPFSPPALRLARVGPQRVSLMAPNTSGLPNPS